MHPLLSLHPEIATALAQNLPVVALESTIITHGMPWPQNVETALRVEQTVRQHGAIPATIAILNGKLKIGLTQTELTALGQTGQRAVKASRRDLAVLLATGQTGATTVAATMFAAHLAGIRVFATGGIGGVHRGAQETWDVSADLPELAQTPVAVVCAGAKSILDLPLTLEWLETHGVPVLGYQTDEFPAFFTRESGLQLETRLETPAEIARVLRLRWQLGHGGVVVANPIPREFALPHTEIEQAIAQALAEAQARGIAGKAVTPFLLARLEALTAGKSLAANVELVLNNARLAAEIARELAR